MRHIRRSPRCHAVSDAGDRCVKPDGHDGTSYMHSTAPDEDGMSTIWGEMPDGTELVECGVDGCDFGLIADTDSVVVAHDHTDNSHSWIRSDGEVGSIHIDVIDCD